MFFIKCSKTKHQIKTKKKKKKEEKILVIVLAIYYTPRSHLNTALNKIDSLLSIQHGYKIGRHHHSHFLDKEPKTQRPNNFTWVTKPA